MRAAQRVKRKNLKTAKDETPDQIKGMAVQGNHNLRKRNHKDKRRKRRSSTESSLTRQQSDRELDGPLYITLVRSPDGG